MYIQDVYKIYPHILYFGTDLKLWKIAKYAVLLRELLHPEERPRKRLNLKISNEPFPKYKRRRQTL